MKPDLSAVRIIFVSAASITIGFGHLSRCLALALFAQECGGDVCFLIFGDTDAKLRVNAAGFDCSFHNESAMSSLDWAKVQGRAADVVIVDLLFPGFFTAVRPLQLFRHLRRLGRCLVAIDVLGDESIACRLPELDVDILVSPYVGPRINLQEARWSYLEGPEYALVSPEYANLLPRRQRLVANRILVSCGGSDPKAYTVEVLRGLDTIPHHLEIRVVVGPLFSADLRTEVRRLAAMSKQQITLVNSPSTLLNEMLWCDLAIGSNGLTKYELAASSTPALLFSIDQHHDLVNRSFADMQTSIDLGIGVSAKQVACETLRLLRNPALREAMARQCRAVVDGFGAQRFFTEIIKELSCWTTN